MSPLIITDASALIGLERIDQLELLPALFTEIIAPPAVIAEFGSHPAWLREAPVSQPDQVRFLRTLRLGPGEAEAITLALESPGALLLIDERRGRRYALSQGIDVVGTLGILQFAKRAGQVPTLRPLVDALRSAGFHCSDALYRRVLTEVGESPA